MIANLIYNAGKMLYEAMPTETDRKGALISDISTIQIALGKGAVDANQFEHLMSLDIDQLVNVINDQSSLLSHLKNQVV